MRALRLLAKSPGFSLTVIATLALGIGANTAIFSVVSAVLFSPLPYPAADRLVSIQSRNQQQDLHDLGLAPAGFRELERQTTSFEHVAAYRYNYTNLTRIEKPVLLTDSLVSQNFFDVLGAGALLGRTFQPSDAAPGAKPTVVLGYRIWQGQFAGRPDIVGKTIMLDDVPHVVIGVMPRSFKEPRDIAGVWRVFPNTGGENLAADSRFWNVIGRLKAGTPPSTLNAELATISSRLAGADPKFYRGWDFTTQPLQDLLVGQYRKGLLLVVGAALLVLLVMCANVAGLQLVRASARQRDTAIRLALGASRWTIAREHLAESLLLVAFGGAAGVLLAQWGVTLLLASLSDGWLPRSDEIAINARVLLVTGGAALLIGLAFGLYPAFRAAQVDASDSLREGSKGSVGPRSTRFRSALVIGQIALTLVLLVCAGLVLKSFAAIMRVNPGLQIEHTLSLGVSPAWTRYNTDQKRDDFYRQIVDRVSTLPGVELAAFTETMPFTWGIPATFLHEGRTDDTEKLPAALYDSVSPSFFSTMRVPLIAGRTFSETDDAKTRPVIVLSRLAAQKFFPNENPIGRRLVIANTSPATPLEVIGVVGDVPRNGLDAPVPYQVYASLHQRTWYFATLLVRSAVPVETLTRSIERQIWSIDPDQPIANVAPVRQLVKAQLTLPQLYLTLFSLFAVLALLLAVLGLYGLVAYNVAQRTREFGIRVALGAQTQDMLRLVLGQGAQLTAAGLGLGLAVAFATARLMQALLFRTTAYDPLVFGAVVVVLGAISLLAALLPARRALKVDPIVALRGE